MTTVEGRAGRATALNAHEITPRIGTEIRADKATMHRPTPYDPNSGRLLQRTKLAGEAPFD
jgi:hypothetical protein